MTRIIKVSRAKLYAAPSTPSVLAFRRLEKAVRWFVDKGICVTVKTEPSDKGENYNYTIDLSDPRAK